MPLYDLRCMDCKSEHSIRATMTERAKKAIECPQCGSNELESLFKRAPLLKGMVLPSGGKCSGCRGACATCK